jgi:tetratricopeptide (TPR) repeat protein
MTLHGMVASLLLGFPQDAGPIAINRLEPVAGIVVDEEGRPIEGAEVLAAASLEGAGRAQWTARTDVSGHFEIKPPPDALSGSSYFGWLGLQARWPGRRPAALPMAKLAGRRPYGRLVLPTGGGTRIQVLGPDNQPLRGARVNVPFGVQGLGPGSPPYFEAETDAEGRVAVPDLTPEDLIQGIDVTAPGLGSQHARLEPTRGDERIARLVPAGRLVGRVVVEPQDVAHEVKLTVNTYGPGTTTGVARPEPDEQGRFEVPAIAVGRVLLSAGRPADSPYWNPRTSGATVEAGRTTEVEVRLERGVLVRGLVRERDSHRPVCGATVMLRSKLETRPATTGADGRFVATMPPGLVNVTLERTLPYRAAAEPAAREVEGVEGSESVEVPPFEVVRGLDVSGFVRDEAGAPAEGAEVAACWVAAVDARTRLERLTTSTNARGEYRLEGLPSEHAILLSARLGEAASGPASVLKLGEAGSMDLDLSRENTMSLGGRVVDDQGRPIDGAIVRIDAAPALPGGGSQRDTFVQFDDTFQLQTDASGRFETPRVLRRDEFHRVSVRAVGHDSWLTALFAPTTPSFFDIVLHRTRPPEIVEIRRALESAQKAAREGNRGEIVAANARVLAGMERIDKLVEFLDFELLNQLSENMLTLRRPDKAELIARTTLDLIRNGPGGDALRPDAEYVAVAILASALKAQGKLDEAAGVLDEGMALHRNRRPGHPYLAWLLILRADLHRRAGEPERADTALAEAADLSLRVYGEPGAWLARASRLRAAIASEAGRLDEADSLLGRALRNGEGMFGETSPWVAETLDERAAVLRKLGHQAEADAASARARAIRDGGPPA